MLLKAAFIFLAPNANPATHHSQVDTEQVKLSVYGVPDNATACSLSQNLATQGINAIELCTGFGVQGAAAVRAAVPDGVSVRWSREV